MHEIYKPVASFPGSGLHISKFAQVFRTVAFLLSKKLRFFSFQNLVMFWLVWPGFTAMLQRTILLWDKRKIYIYIYYNWKVVAKRGPQSRLIHCFLMKGYSLNSLQNEFKLYKWHRDPYNLDLLHCNLRKNQAIDWLCWHHLIQDNKPNKQPNCCCNSNETNISDKTLIIRTQSEIFYTFLQSLIVCKRRASFLPFLIYLECKTRI